MKKIIFILFLLIQVFHPCLAMTIDQIVIFGDSLSDTGNVFSLTSKAHRIISQIPIVPKDPPYYQGRFSNGPIWIDELVKTMNIPLIDYAYGGSWAESITNSKFYNPIGLGVQIELYRAAAILDFHKDQHLYIIWSGANDYLDGRDDAESATTNTIESIRSDIETLIYMGAKHIMVMNIPDLGVVPGVVAKGKDFAEAVGHLSQLHNQKFVAMMEEEKKNNPNIQIISLDIESHFDDMILHPDKYQLKNVTEACYDGGYALVNQHVDIATQDAMKKIGIDIEHSLSLKTAYLAAKAYEMGTEHICFNPDEYLFWDQVHPTTKVHTELSVYVYNKLLQNDVHS